MGKRVCPWWVGALLASPVRRWIQGDPEQLVRRYVREGMTVLEPGPGMGFFTLPLARLVGTSGRVIAVDVQAQMLAGLRRRLDKAGLTERVDVRLGQAESMGLADLAAAVAFTFAFAVVHEFPSAEGFFSQVGQACKPGGIVFFAEPSGHVKPAEYEKELQAAVHAGFSVTDRLAVRGSTTVLLRKS